MFGDGHLAFGFVGDDSGSAQVGHGFAELWVFPFLNHVWAAVWAEGILGDVGDYPQVGFVCLVEQGLFCVSQDGSQLVWAVYLGDELVRDERVITALVESFLEVFVRVDAPLQVAFVGRLALDEIGA